MDPLQRRKILFILYCSLIGIHILMVICLNYIWNNELFAIIYGGSMLPCPILGFFEMLKKLLKPYAFWKCDNCNKIIRIIGPEIKIPLKCPKCKKKGTMRRFDPLNPDLGKNDEF